MNDIGPTANQNGSHLTDDKDDPALLFQNDGHRLLDRLWAYDSVTVADDHPADLGTGLVSLALIRAAIRRRAWFLCVMSLIGLLSGLALYIALPPSHQASATLLLTYGPYENPLTAPADEAALAHSREVTSLALRKLGLRESVSGFVSSYTVAPISSRVLAFTMSAPSSAAAVHQANAVAAAFIQFRGGQLETEQNLVLNSLNQQINQARLRVNAITRQINQLPPQPTSQRQRFKLASLQSYLGQANSVLSGLEQTVTSVKGNVSSIAALRDSEVLDSAAPIPQSKLKGWLEHAAIGLLLGLFLGTAIVIVSSATSSRLRQREEISKALSASVKLSVGKVRLSWWWPSRRGLRGARDPNVRRIVAHLARTVATRLQGVPALAVIPVDEPRTAAVSLASMAVSAAEEGKRVILADLCRNAPAARLLRADKPGVHEVRRDLVVAVPDSHDVAPTGPREHGEGCHPVVRLAGRSERRSAFTEAVTAACASADLVLTLATLDPSLGGEHLATWADDAVAVVTAGRSSWTRIHSFGEMVRLAGMRLMSAVLVAADKTDESLGVTHLEIGHANEGHDQGSAL